MTKWIIFVSTPYGQSLYRILMSSFLHISIIIWEGVDSSWINIKTTKANGSSTGISEWSLIFRVHPLPLQPLLNNEIYHCAIVLFQLIDVFSIPSQIWGKASETVKAISPFRWNGSATFTRSLICEVEFTYILLHLLPCCTLILVIWNTHNFLVTFRWVDEEFRALVRPLVPWDVHEPEGELLHLLAIYGGCCSDKHIEKYFAIRYFSIFQVKKGFSTNKGWRMSVVFSFQKSFDLSFVIIRTTAYYSYRPFC